MKRFLFVLLILANTLPANAEKVVLVDGSAIGDNCVDVYRDLDCVRWYYSATPPGAAGGTSPDDARGNSDKINAWFDANIPASGEVRDGYVKKNTLLIPYGYIALAEPIGVKSSQTLTWSNSTDPASHLLGSGPVQAGHPRGWPNYTQVQYTQSAGGTGPPNLVSGEWYYVVNVTSGADAGKIKLATTYDNARAGVYVPWSDYAPSGTSELMYRTLPSNFSLICGGGWSNTTYGVGYFLNNLCGGIIWQPGIAKTDDVPIRLTRHGNIIRLNITASPWVGASTPTRPYARAAIQMFDEGRLAGETGRHEISLNAQGFQSAIRIDQNGPGFADETSFPYLFTRDCYSLITNEANNQSIGHSVNFACYYCPVGDNGTVFNLQDGGIWNIDHLSIVGNGGVTVCQMNSQNGSNQGEFQIGHLHVDKALTNATKSAPTTQSVTASNSGGKLLLTGNIDWDNGTRVCFPTTAPGGVTQKQLYYVTGKTFSAGTWTAYLANTHDLAIRNLSFDRVAYSSSSGSYALASTKGYFRLFDSYRQVCSKIRMTGIISYAGESLRSATGWMNYFGESLVNYSNPLTFAGIPNSEFRDVVLDIVGLDDVTEVQYGSRKKIIQIPVVAPTANVGAADGQAVFVVPSAYAGYRIAKIQGDVVTAGSGSGDTTIQIDKSSGGGAYANILSTLVAIAPSTITNGNTPVITRDTPEGFSPPNPQADEDRMLANNARERVLTNDRLRVDVKSVSTTPPKGLIVTIWLVP